MIKMRYADVLICARAFSNGWPSGGVAEKRQSGNRKRVRGYEVGFGATFPLFCTEYGCHI